MNVRAPSLMILTIVVLVAAALQSPVAFTQSNRQVAGQPGKPGEPDPAQSADALRDPAYRSPSDRHKVVISDRQFAQSLQSQGSRLVGDYGGFLVLDVDTRTADALGKESAVEEHDDFNLIMLNAGPIDTTLPQAAALRHPVGAFAGKRMHLVQFAGPIRPEW